MNRPFSLFGILVPLLCLCFFAKQSFFLIFVFFDPNLLLTVPGPKSLLYIHRVMHLIWDTRVVQETTLEEKPPAPGIDAKLLTSVRNVFYEERAILRFI